MVLGTALHMPCAMAPEEMGETCVCHSPCFLRRQVLKLAGRKGKTGQDSREVGSPFPLLLSSLLLEHVRLQDEGKDDGQRAHSHKAVE